MLETSTDRASVECGEGDFKRPSLPKNPPVESVNLIRHPLTQQVVDLPGQFTLQLFQRLASNKSLLTRLDSTHSASSSRHGSRREEEKGGYSYFACSVSHCGECCPDAKGGYWE